MCGDRSTMRLWLTSAVRQVRIGLERRRPARFAQRLWNMAVLSPPSLSRFVCLAIKRCTRQLDAIRSARLLALLNLAGVYRLKKAS